MRIVLILSANIKINPYVEIFRKILNDNKVDYDIISWDRESLGEDEGIVFKHPAPNTRSDIGKFLDYYSFARFARSVLIKNKYDKLVVFGAAIGVFMYNFLSKHYRNRFWFDYRDLTIEQRFLKRFKKLLDISSYISISSPGFKRAIPGDYDFILSHNFDIDEVRRVLKDTSVNSGGIPEGKPVVISTIGGIRDYSANVEVIESLKNKPDFELKFIGRGPSAEPLRQYVSDAGITNVEFTGFYLKKDECRFYEQTDFVNIYYPRILSHETALSNRFYKAMVFKKPMIVTNHSTQGDYVEKYQLGLSLNDCSGLSCQIKEFVGHFDHNVFCGRCNALLQEFVGDYERFYNKFMEFINHD